VESCKPASEIVAMARNAMAPSSLWDLMKLPPAYSKTHGHDYSTPVPGALKRPDSYEASRFKVQFHCI
jgi:hypothetical protein